MKTEYSNPRHLICEIAILIGFSSIVGAIINGLITAISNGYQYTILDWIFISIALVSCGFSFVYHKYDNHELSKI